MDTLTIWAAILLGLIQGISEFLPISSSGHLSVLQNLFGMSTAENGHLFFDVLLHFGTLISICVVYWQDIVRMVFEVKALAGGKGTKKGANTRNLSAARLFLMLIIGTLPLFLVLPINDYVERLYYQTFFIGAAFILTGCLLFVADKMQPGDRGEKSMRVRDALVIGLCQAIATIPGLSRSGTTISAGIATGLDRDFAVKYSFLLSLPAVLGANVLGIAKAAKEGIEISLIPVYLIGMAVAMITGIFAIGLVKRLASKGKFGYFAYYCWGAGIITMILSLIF
ncbi:MAG TPA: undecaprenyl-diphosphate phosphatase [Clostridiales bacterium]|nr:undecaprenyl-diphosphate phosphatase [Clostridiales bacterium]